MIRKLTKYKVLALLMVCVWTNSIVAQQRQSTGKTQVMILGVYHFANPNLDMIKTNHTDHLSEKKQKEIAELLDLLARFKPTKIVVEAIPENEKVKNDYSEYLKGNYQLTANEIDQIGFRLAKRFDHKQIYLADNQIGMDFNSVFATANQTKNTKFLQDFQKATAEIQASQKKREAMTVRQSLVDLNQPALLEETRNLYLQLTRVKSKDKFEGADLLSNWYQRNFRIFSNIIQIIESSNDRVLVIFGSGHAPYLRDAVKSYSDLQLIEPNYYLKR